MAPEAEEILLEDGEPYPPRIKGTVKPVIENIEERNYNDERGCVPVNVGRGIDSAFWGEWHKHMKHNLDGADHEFLCQSEHSDEFKEIVIDYFNSNEELKERFKEVSYWCHDGAILINIKSAEEQGGIGELLENHGKRELARAAYEGDNEVKSTQGNSNSVDDEQHRNQTSFGESKFPELYDIGVVDDEGRMHRSKLRGLVKAFAKDIDAIRGETPNFEVKWAQHAFLYWGSDRWDKEWIDILVKYMGTDYIYDAVSYMYSSDDEVAELFEEKYEGEQSLEVGNPDTDDLLEAFLDSEAPGWEEEEEEEKDDGRTDHWDEYEQQSQQKPTEEERGRIDTEEQDDKSKWEQFEEESKACSANDNRANGEGEQHDAREVRADDTESADDGPDSPGTLGGWAEKEGKADPEEFKSNGSKKREATTNSTETEVESGSSTSSTTERQVTTVECEDGGRPHPIKWPEVGRIDELERNKIYEGNTFEWAMKLPKNSIDTLVTSPPYYALRDYDIEDAYPISGDFTCEHNWENEFCTKCGAFLGQLGHEPDPATFVEHVVDLMDRYKEVLKPSGSLWLNIGDTYAGKNIDGRVKAPRKSRMMIPERIYRRMVQTGWHLRDYVIWVKKVWMPDDDLKGNGKPFAGSSRLADQWEPMVRFTPQADHYSDVDSNRLRPPSFSGDLGTKGIEGKFREGEDTQRGKTYNELGTNPPDVWLINSDGYDGDHRAVFPEELPKRCINISTPDRVCEICGRPFDKEVHVEDDKKLSAGGDYATYERRCHHEAGHKPGIAFDPFLGSGTTGVAAANSGFDWVGVELSEKYAQLARERIPTGRQVGLDQY